MQENNTQAAIDAGKALDAATQLAEFVGEIPFLFAPHDFKLHSLLELVQAQDQRNPQPRFLGGVAKAQDEASFCVHANRFKDPNSAIFADGAKITAVYDYHLPIAQPTVPAQGQVVTPRDPNARWQRHRAEYAPQKSPEWMTWLSNAGKMMSQTDFADFLEANVQDIAGPTDDRKVPTPADLCTLALTLKVTSNDELASEINRTTGEYMLIAKKEQKTTGSATIPKEFDLLIPLYERGEPIRITCKFRLRSEGGAFKYGWVIPTAARLERKAFEGVCERIMEATALPLFFGSPEQ